MPIKRGLSFPARQDAILFSGVEQEILHGGDHMRRRDNFRARAEGKNPGQKGPAVEDGDGHVRSARRIRTDDNNEL